MGVLIGGIVSGDPSSTGVDLELVTIDAIVNDSERDDCIDSCDGSAYTVQTSGGARTLWTSTDYDLGELVGVCRTATGSLSAESDCPSSDEHIGRFLASVGLGIAGAVLLYWRSKRQGEYPEEWDAKEVRYPRLVPGTMKACALGVGIAIVVQTTLICVRPVTGPIVAARLLDDRPGAEITVADGALTATAEVDREWIEAHYPTGLALMLASEEGAAGLPPELGLSHHFDPDAFRTDQVTVYRSLVGGSRIWTWGDALGLYGCTALVSALLQWARFKIGQRRDSSRPQRPELPGDRSDSQITQV